MKYELNLNEDQYQRLNEILEKARETELSNIQDVTDTNAFSEVSALSRIQDALAIQHGAPEQPRGIAQALQGAFQRAFDAKDAQTSQESLENSLNAEMGVGELIDRFLQEIDASPGGIDGRLEAASKVNLLERANN